MEYIYKIDIKSGLYRVTFGYENKYSIMYV